jgi:hypothetical protein
MYALTWHNDERNNFKIPFVAYLRNVKSITTEPFKIKLIFLHSILSLSVELIIKYVDIHPCFHVERRVAVFSQMSLIREYDV